MKDKLNIAFIFHKNNIFLSGQHFDNTYFNFFINALKRCDKINVRFFPTENYFDIKKIGEQFDGVLLWENNDFGMPKEIENIKKINLPIIAKSSDPNVAKKSLKYHKKWKIDYYFHFYHEDFFHEFYPKEFKFKTIFFGIEPSLYQNIVPYDKRIKNRILNTGATGSAKKISSLINYIKSPKWNPNKAYYLRTKCNELPYVDHTPTLQHKYTNDNYPKLLQKYCAAISATTYAPNMKYWETLSAGCLTFMEITKKNRGKNLGFEDNKSAIFINEDNYAAKFENYLPYQ